MTKLPLVWGVLLAASCGEDRAAAPKPSTPPPPDPTQHCTNFVSFAWSCGIGRPDRDPTVDAATQANNDVLVQLAIIERCQRRLPPFDEGLIACFQSAGGDCAVYRACADKVVAARRDAGTP